MRLVNREWPNPWQSHSVWDEFDQLFNHLQSQTVGGRFYSTPYCEVDESESHFLMSFDLPGVDRKDLNIEIDQDILTISGERKLGFRESGHASQGSGRWSGQFIRRFKLPDGINEENIDAHFENGVLQLLIAKAKKKQPRKIEVKSERGGFLEKLKSFSLGSSMSESKTPPKGSSQAS